MARPAKLDLQKVWEERINLAKKKRDEWKQLMRVDLALDFFDGKQNPGYPESEWITINKIYSHLMAQLPSLYSVDPYYYVKLKKSFNPDPKLIAQYDMKASIRQSYLNYLKGELELKTKARLCIQDAYFAFGVMKIHYYSDQKENPDYGKMMADDNGNELKDEAGNPLEEPETVPINERYCISRVDFDDFLFDEDAGPLSDKWGWVAERIRLTKDEAEKKFSKKILKKLKPSDKEGKEKSISVGDIKPKQDRDVYVLWEIYDLKNKEWLTICEGANEIFQEPESLPKGVESHPYSLLRFTLRKKSAYPIPPVSQAIDPQKELCLSRSQMLTHRKRFNRKYEVVESKLVDPDSEISKLENGDDGTCIRVQANGAVTPIADAPLDQMRILELQALDRDITEVFGDAGESRGIADADSATQADIMDRRLEIREGDKLSIVTDFLSDIAKKLDQLVQAHISKDEAVKVVGPDGEFWSLIKTSDYDKIEGEYEYSVNVGSTAPRLPHIERAQWTAFLSQVVIPMPHVLTAPHFMQKMAQMYGIEDKAAIEELRQIGLKIMNGQMPMPGGGQSQPGEENPVAAIIGAATGALGGNANGGGAPGGMMN
jgi:hypothetical protein